MKRLVDWLRREWALLRNYRRPHVTVSFDACVFDGAHVDLPQIARALSLPEVYRVDPGGDVFVRIQGCHFTARSPFPSRGPTGEEIRALRFL